jgi:hypothetical protein
MGSFNKKGQINLRGSFSERWPRKFCSETFYNSYKNLIQTPKKFNNFGRSWITRTTPGTKGRPRARAAKRRKVTAKGKTAAGVNARKTVDTNDETIRRRRRRRPSRR